MRCFTALTTQFLLMGRLVQEKLTLWKEEKGQRTEVMLKANAEDGHIYTKTHQWGYKDIYGHVQWDDGGGEVKQILIWHKDIIFGLKTIYEKDNTIFTSQMHGFESGNLEIIRPTEPLTWISGHYVASGCGTYLKCHEKVISSLKFGNGKETFGPFGSEKGEPFHYKGKEEITGFHGCSKNEKYYGHISAIGLHIKIKPSVSVNGMKRVKDEKAR